MSINKKISIRREKKSSVKSTDKSKNELQETEQDAAVSDYFKEMTGSSYAETGKLFFEQVLSVIPAGLLNEQASLDVVVAMFLDIKPKDGIEAMLAAQMIAVHLTSMKMASYSSVNSQPLEAVNSAVNNTSKLMRTFVLQLEIGRAHV